MLLHSWNRVETSGMPTNRDNQCFAMSAILYTAFPQSAEELFNIEGQAFPVSVSDPFHRNYRHQSEDSIRNFFILDPGSQLVLRA